MKFHRDRNRRPVRRVPVLEGMEPRHVPGSALSGIGALVSTRLRVDPRGVQAIFAALGGGLGNEFIQVLRRQVRNPLRIVREFVSGQRTTFSTRGFAALTHSALPTYQGGFGDQQLPRAAGAVVLPNGQLSLAALMRGPINEPQPVRYVWALNLGRGATVQFPQYPGIVADTLVRIDHDVNRNITLTIDDLVSGTSRTLDPSRGKIAGPTVRLRLTAADLPSGGKPLRQARFAFWVQDTPGGLETVANFLPQTSIPVGVLPRR